VVVLNQMTFVLYLYLIVATCVLPVLMICALECRMCFENEFRVLLKSLSEICKFCCTMWNCLWYWQQTPQLAKCVQAIENFLQPMDFSVLAIEENCKVSMRTSESRR